MTNRFTLTFLASLALSTAGCDELFGGDDGNDVGDGGGTGDDDRGDDDDDDRGDDDDDDRGDDDDDDDDDAEDETGSPPDDPEPPAGGYDCPQLWNCYAACETDECFYDCYDDATAEAQALDDAIYSCQQAFGCTDVDCLIEYCSPELDACFGDVPDPDPDPSAGSQCEDIGGYPGSPGFCVYSCGVDGSCPSGTSCDSLYGWCEVDGIAECYVCAVG